MITLEQRIKLELVARVCEEVMFYASILLVTSWATLLGIVMFNGIWTMFSPMLHTIHGLVGGSIAAGVTAVVVLGVTYFVYNAARKTLDQA